MQKYLTLCFALCLFSASVFAEEEEEEKEVEKPVLTYYQIKPSLVANLASGGEYIRTDIQLMTEDPEFIPELELHAPAVRHTLLLLLSDQDGKSIKSPDGKEALRKAALSAVEKLMQDLSGKEEIKALYFTTFFVQ
jgi:flagellar FliL protein